MCHHTGLLVCFACLFLSTGSSSTTDKSIDADLSCSTAKIYEKYNKNGSLSLESLDQILTSFRSICLSQANVAVIDSHHSGGKANLNLTTETTEEGSSGKASAWFYAGVCVLFISACGLAAVAVIKILPAWLFQPTIQFLVALAVGTLTGDAILHLIPHAFTNHGEHEHGNGPLHSGNHSHASHGEDAHHNVEENRGHDNAVVWRGVLILAILLIFFVIERLLSIFGEWKQRLQSSKQVDKVVHLISESSKMVGDKLCKHHQENHRSHNHNHDHLENHGDGDQRLLESREATQSSDEQNADLLVSCVKEVTFLNNGDEACASALPQENDCSNRDEQYKGCSDWQGLVVGKPLIYCASHDICDGSDARTSDSQRHQEAAHSDHLVSLKAKGSETASEDISTNRQTDSLTVYISEHHTSHHGHSHSHGHIHARPNGVASLAWLVLAGDGIHNLTDGLAIGAAFAGSLTGGFTTAFAVLCHELPHELGDFAVLLKAGMTVKQAMVCNLISSFLCLIGVLLGLGIGSAREASQWIFAATGGMFIYIALVDMMPELSGHVNKNRSAFLLLAIQMAGMICGFGIMLVIALYEHELSTILQSQL